MSKDLKEKVKKVIDEKIRPYLQSDGGDVELVDVDEEGKVKVKLTGACGGCPFAIYTLKYFVEYTLRKEIPEIKEVVI